MKGEIITADTNNPQAQQRPPEPGPEHELLDVFIGKWINEGHTVASAGAPAVEILTSDVYEWMPGGFFVLHHAYGRVGDMDVGATETIGYDEEASKKYRTHLFDGRGNVTTEELRVRDDTRAWKGEATRRRATFTDDGRTQTAHHERIDDEGNRVPSMEVTLTKVE